MKAISVGAIVGLMAACAIQTQAAAQEGPSSPLSPPSAQPLGAGEVNVSNDLKYRYGESQIAVNPKNSRNLVIAAQELGFGYACQQAKSPDCEIVQSKLVGPGQPQIPQPRGTFTQHGNFNKQIAFVSFDRGKTWKRVQLPTSPKGHPNLTGRGDPSVTAMADGTFYFSWDSLDWGTPENALPAAGVAASKSTDGGLTWSEPVLTGVPADGPKITADLNTGAIYVAGSSALGPISTGNPNAPFNPHRDRWLVSSKDGVHWTKPEGMGGMASMSAAHAVLAAVFLTAPQDSAMTSANSDLCGGAPAPCVVFETTRNAGAKWSRMVMSVHSDAATRPAVAADPSKAGHFAVAVPVNHAKEIYVYETRDFGRTWSGPAKVAEDATKQHYHHWIAYSPSGVLGLIWRTRQAPAQAAAATPGQPGFGMGPSTPYNVWAVISRDGGTTFSAPLEVSTADSPPPQSGMMGNSGDDYTGLALDRQYLYATWADWRPGERQNLFRAIKLDAFKATN